MALTGMRVFVVEDEALVLLELQDMLTDRGLVVAASALRLDEAVEIAAEVDCDAAILDVNLAGKRIDPVARVLADRGIPFIFVSGYDRNSLSPDFRERPLVAKPYGPRELEAALARFLSDKTA